jgi:integrase
VHALADDLAIRTDDVEFFEDGHTNLHVRGTIIFKKGQGTVRQESPKNNKARSLSVAAWVGDLLQERAARSRSGLLWETQRSANAYQQQNLLRDLRQIVAGTELSWVTSHTLRTTAGTMIARSSGVSAATSALGHSSDAITRRIYIDEAMHPTDISLALAEIGPSVAARLDERHPSHQAL